MGKRKCMSTFFFSFQQKPGRRSHAEARPGRVRRSLAAGRVPKPGPARRGRPDPARPHGEVRSGPAGPSAARPGTARPAEGHRRERRTRRR